MNLSPEGRPSSHGPEAYRTIREKAPAVLPLTHPYVQADLAEAAFPEKIGREVMEAWLAPDDNGHSLSKRFREYIESPACTITEIDTKDPEAMTSLLEAVRVFRPSFAISSHRAESLLKSSVFLYDDHRAERWEKEGWADRYKAYCAAHPEATIDVNDDAQIEALVKAIEAFPPATIH